MNLTLRIEAAELRDGDLVLLRLPDGTSAQTAAEYRRILGVVEEYGDRVYAVALEEVRRSIEPTAWSSFRAAPPGDLRPRETEEVRK